MWSRSVRPAGEARQTAVAVVGLCGHLHRAGERVLQRHEPGRRGAAGLGQRVELLLGGLDHVPGRSFRIAGVGALGDVAADADQLAAQGELVNRAAIVGGSGGRRCAVDQVGEVADRAQLDERFVALELLGEQRRVG